MADLYGTITDDAVNRIINFLHARAPYLFSYVAPSVKLQTDDVGNVTGFVAHWLTCSEVAPDPPRGVLRYRRIPPLPLPGLAVKLPCSIQLIDVNIDFHPSDAVALPVELAPPLADQRFAIQAMVHSASPACRPVRSRQRTCIPLRTTVRARNAASRSRGVRGGQWFKLRQETEMATKRFTHPVSDEKFRKVYDSPASLPGRHKWLTPDGDVREIEKLLGMPPNTIGAPLWVSGDRKRCSKCRRETNWLDIVTSALGEVHSREMIARVILGNQKFVNTEAPRAIAGLRCFRCQTVIDNLRSFKCHNWAYAKPALLKVIKQIEAKR